jgi:hypothetical protein
MQTRQSIPGATSCQNTIHFDNSRLLTFHQVNGDAQWWSRQARFSDLSVFQTKEWIQFIQDSQHATPVFAEIRDGSSLVGCFSGLIISPFGIRILGSPFPGWKTMYMGFNLEANVPRWMALRALSHFAFHELSCLHFEISDRLFVPEDRDRSDLEDSSFHSYETDLTRSEEELFHNLEQSCRTCVRKAKKCGVVIEEAPPDDSFVDEYYVQLKDVFLRQGLVPTYDRDLVRLFIDRIYPTGRLLLLRARDASGRCIATGLYPGTEKLATFWGNASFRSSLHLRPNQAMNWYAMQYWHSRRSECFDWGGEGSYKEKYGCRKVTVHRFSKSRIPFLSKLRDHARDLSYWKLQLQGWWALHNSEN